jgi:hypothetical protein
LPAAGNGQRAIFFEATRTVALILSDTQGRLLFQAGVEAGGSIEIPAAALSLGMNVLRVETKVEGQGYVYKIMRM